MPPYPALAFSLRSPLPLSPARPRRSSARSMRAALARPCAFEGESSAGCAVLPPGRLREGCVRPDAKSATTPRGCRRAPGHCAFYLARSALRAAPATTRGDRLSARRPRRRRRAAIADATLAFLKNDAARSIARGRGLLHSQATLSCAAQSVMIADGRTRFAPPTSRSWTAEAASASPTKAYGLSPDWRSHRPRRPELHRRPAAGRSFPRRRATLTGWDGTWRSRRV